MQTNHPFGTSILATSLSASCVFSTLNELPKKAAYTPLVVNSVDSPVPFDQITDFPLVFCSPNERIASFGSTAQTVRLHRSNSLVSFPVPAPISATGFHGAQPISDTSD